MHLLYSLHKHKAAHNEYIATDIIINVFIIISYHHFTFLWNDKRKNARKHLKHFFFSLKHGVTTPLYSIAYFSFVFRHIH